MLYCEKIRRDQGNSPIGIALADQPLTEFHKKLGSRSR
jgi:hypothetical protein